MEMVDEKTGEIIGFDVDLVDAICERINCVPQFVTTAWDGIFAALQQGEFDMVVSGVSITPEINRWTSVIHISWLAKPSWSGLMMKA